ncbi:hypothetical protein BDZ91DRAFT_764087 [Kalaharituber pfeilii]|nr:hypothetical protein BDZ91DRAFT_764087 [Kalaharituber pfeilii]
MSTSTSPDAASPTTPIPDAIPASTTEAPDVPMENVEPVASGADEEKELAQLTASAVKAYSLKQYPLSTTLFASACELQARIRGSEDDPRNAHLLYLYGKSLYQVAVSKSDILGTAAKKDDDTKGETKAKSKKDAAGAATGAAAAAQPPKGGVFSFQGDENWDNSDEEGGEEEGNEDGEGEGAEDGEGGGAGDEEDDFANAWEILDLARVLFHKSLDPNYTSTTASNGDLSTIAEEPAAADAAATANLTEEQIRETKMHLADTYDLLGEISLESESFPQAVKDLRSSLELKSTLLPFSDKLISEAHYKLSLALEFEAAMEGVPDELVKKGREAAAEHMEKAIQSCKERIAIEEDAIRESEGGGDDKGKGKGKAKDVTSKSLEDAREIVRELEQRLVDLRAPVEGEEGQSEVVKDLLRELVGGGGEGTEERRKRVEEAVKAAKDVSGLVKKKPKPKPVPEAAPAPAPAQETAAETELAPAPIQKEVVVSQPGGAKRKIEDVEKMDVEGKVVEGGGVNAGSKKAKVEDTIDEEEKEGGSASVVGRGGAANGVVA